MSRLWYPGKPRLNMDGFNAALKEDYLPAMRRQLNEPSAWTHTRHTLHVVTERWWEAEPRIVTWHVERNR